MMEAFWVTTALSAKQPNGTRVNEMSKSGQPVHSMENLYLAWLSLRDNFTDQCTSLYQGAAFIPRIALPGTLYPYAY